MYFILGIFLGTLDTLINKTGKQKSFQSLEKFLNVHIIKFLQKLEVDKYLEKKINR